MKKLETVEFAMRHGELNVDVFTGTVPGELVESKETVVLAGSHDSEHTLPAGTLVARDGLRTYVRVKATASIRHRARHVDSAPLSPENIYVIWPSIERFGTGDAAIED